MNLAENCIVHPFVCCAAHVCIRGHSNECMITLDAAAAATDDCNILYI